MTYQKQCEAAAGARGVLTREIRVFKRSRVAAGGPFVKTVDLGVMPSRQYKALKETDMDVYVGCFTDVLEAAYRRLVDFYLGEIETQELQNV